MKKLNNLLILTFAIFLSMVLVSCGDDDPQVINEFERGVFVVNEGNFGSGNGSVSHFNPASEEVKFNVFSQNNEDKPLGDVVQSMTLDGVTGYIVVNNSNKVEVVNYTTMVNHATIEGLSMPRYLTLGGNKGYISEWVEFDTTGRVSVFNPGTSEVIKRIQVGFGAEYLLINDGNLYVSNTRENTISVIDLASEAVKDTITVSQAPGHMMKDANGKIWVICGGGFNEDWSPANNGALVKINPATNTVEETFEFGANVSTKMAVNPSKDIIYYAIGNAIFALDIASASLPANPLITNDDIVGFYGMGVHPVNGNIYLGDNQAFQSNGFVYRYQPDGTFIDSFDAGIGPNGFAFIP